MSSALKSNCTLKSFTIYAFDSGVDDVLGLAIADVVLFNRTLRLFALYADQHCLIGSDATLVIHDALQNNDSLKAFSINGGFAGAEHFRSSTFWVEMLKKNVTLQSFQWSVDHYTVIVGSQAHDEDFLKDVFQAERKLYDEVVEMLAINATLHKFVIAQAQTWSAFGAWTQDSEELARNRAFQKQWDLINQVANTWIVKTTCWLRTNILRFFLPAACVHKLLQNSPSQRVAKFAEDGIDTPKTHIVPRVGIVDTQVPGIVLQDIAHGDLPAVIDPLEASIVTRQLWETAIERQAPEATSISTQSELSLEDLVKEEIVLLQFNRNPHEMLFVLSEGLPLKRCRDDLEQAGHAWRLPGGGMIFVHPWQLRTSMHALNGKKTKQSTVVTASSLEHLIELSLAEIGQGRQGAWVKSREKLIAPAGPCDMKSEATTGEDAQDDSTLSLELFNAIPHWTSRLDVEVKRSFLCSVTRDGNDVVIQSTTDAYSSGQNPRIMPNFAPLSDVV